MTRTLFAALLVAAGCSDYGLSHNRENVDGPQPEILLEPELLDFWQVRAGESAELPFTIRNVGDAPLTVDGITIAETPFALVAPEQVGWLLDVGEEVEVPVRFTPDRAGEITGQAVVLSDDPERPEAPVELVGIGLGPQLEITPATHDFGAVDIPCPDEVQLTLQNVGTDDLVLDALQYTSDAQLELLSTLTLPLTLVPGAFTTVDVLVQPVEEGAVSGELVAESNDPRGDQTASQVASPRFQGTASDQFVVPVDPPVDIVFAVDQSCSMDDDAVSLAANFSTFIDAVGAVTSGWRIGVVTWDHACFNNGILDASTTGLDASFTDAVQQGTDLEIVNDEALLQLATRALENTDPGGCNENFLRPGAGLHVIVVSDEPERSVEQAAAWTWSFWLAELQTWVANPSQLVISGVVDIDNCNEGADGYEEAIDATGGSKLSICTGDWAQYAAQLAQVTVQSAWTFPLTDPAEPGSISVTVDGVPTPSGWSYDAANDSLSFDNLSPGSVVDVDYSIVAECP